MEKFSSLYSIVRKKTVIVAHILSTMLLNISFRRALVGDNWDKWLKLVDSLLEVQLSLCKDTFVWNKSKTFSV
jgi:hypothetical protein